MTMDINQISADVPGHLILVIVYVRGLVCRCFTLTPYRRQLSYSLYYSKLQYEDPTQGVQDFTCGIFMPEYILYQHLEAVQLKPVSFGVFLEGLLYIGTQNPPCPLVEALTHRMLSLCGAFQ